jgi:hypothetical protein
MNYFEKPQAVRDAELIAKAEAAIDVKYLTLEQAEAAGADYQEFFGFMNLSPVNPFRGSDTFLLAKSNDNPVLVVPVQIVCPVCGEILTGFVMVTGCSIAPGSGLWCDKCEGMNWL